MKIGDKVKVNMFEVGSEYTVGYIDDRPYGVFLLDPFYESNGGTEEGHWPFHMEEVELVE